jgi:hypothetical protein
MTDKFESLYHLTVHPLYFLFWPLAGFALAYIMTKGGQRTLHPLPNSRSLCRIIILWIVDLLLVLMLVQISPTGAFRLFIRLGYVCLMISSFVGFCLEFWNAHDLFVESVDTSTAAATTKIN